MMEADTFRSVYFLVANETNDDPDSLSGDSNNSAIAASGLTPINNSNNNTPDVELLLTSLIGARRKDLTSVAALTFVYCLLFLTGVIGNVSTCIVIARNSYMHTVTNSYLFSLAVSDVLTLIFGELFCVVFVCFVVVCVCVCVCVRARVYVGFVCVTVSLCVCVCVCVCCLLYTSDAADDC